MLERRYPHRRLRVVDDDNYADELLLPATGRAVRTVFKLGYSDREIDVSLFTISTSTKDEVP